MNARPLQLFFTVIFFLALRVVGDVSAEKIYPLKFTDVDGNELSTTDGHITVLAFVSSSDLDKAQVVGDRVPDYCLGNSNYRMITVVELKTHSGPIQFVFTSIARHRLDTAAKRLQARYDEKKIDRDARRDVFAVVDFGGKIAARLGGQTASSNFRVLVLGPTGELRQQWSEIPSAEELAAALK